MNRPHFVIIAALVLILAGCGGTYVDDKHNFERAFQAKCPDDVKVVHSYYKATPHFTEEHLYYFQMKPSAGSGILKLLTNAPAMVESTNELGSLPFYLNLRSDRPAWFAPDVLRNYTIWYRTNDAFIVLSDKRNSEIFVYGSVGM